MTVERRGGGLLVLLALGGFLLFDFVRATLPAGRSEEPTAVILPAYEPVVAGGKPRPAAAGAGVAAVRPIGNRSLAEQEPEPRPQSLPVIESVPPFAAPRATGSGRRVSRSSLRGRIAGLLGHQNLRGAAVGVAVLSVTHGDVLYDFHGTEPLIVASNEKLLASAAVLCQLGPEYRISTVLLGCGRLAQDGTLEGDLVVRGGGDPDLLASAVSAPGDLLPRLVKAALQTGLRRVTGRLVVDDTLFDREYVSRDWDPAQLCKTYYAPVAGFSLRENCASFEVRPGSGQGGPARVTIVPVNSVFRVAGDVQTGGPRDKNVIHVPAPVSPGPVKVVGSIPLGSNAYTATVPVSAPPLVAGSLLADALGRAGVEVAGGVVLADRSFDPDDPALLRIGSVTTPLAGVLAEMNKESTNVVAEHLFKLAGAAHEGRGTFAAGARAARAALTRFGVDPAGSTSADGSGLSRQNKYAPRQLAALLAALYRSDLRSALLASLPEAGVDGTLQNRLTEAGYRGRVRAKSGYIYQVSALSGYAQTDHGEVLAFSILFNGYQGKNRHMKTVQDSIVKLLVDLEPR